MSTPVSPDGSGTSTRPYLIRALHEWCTDNGYTPYVAVHVDETVQVPSEYVKNGEIVLNVGFEATSSLSLGNDLISFRARFGGVARDIVVPVDRVVAIYARENGQGMAFPVPAPAPTRAGSQASTVAAPGPLRLADAPTAGDDVLRAEPSAGEPQAAAPVQSPSADPTGADSPPPEPKPTGPAPARRPALTRVK